MHYRAMTIADYDKVIQLWQQTPGVRLREADSRQGIEKYLARNPGLSFVAEVNTDLVGTIMAGHDGKRGYIQHLAVAPAQRRSGIATKLVARCLEALQGEDILKSHVMIMADNTLGKQFWRKLGWRYRADVELYSFINGGGENT